jgi:murein DD-endopeptidase
LIAAAHTRKCSLRAVAVALVLCVSACSLAPPKPEIAVQQGIVKTALNQRGVPYRFGGKTPDGFDCSGLVQYVYAQHGIATPRSAHEQFVASAPVPLERLQPGDLLFFRLGKADMHVGIYLGAQEFIHAPSRGKTVILSSLQNVYWRKRFIRAGRLQ